MATDGKKLVMHHERHRMERVGWLRAAVLGANDGIVSTASLVLGVAAADGTHEGILVSGIAGLVAGAMSMAAGEFVSVSSQADIENADLARERAELAASPEGELAELTGIFMDRGLDETLAREVAIQLTENDALAAHAREELGITEGPTARPIQAAFASAGTFSAGAALPLVSAWLSPLSWITWVVSGTALLSLAGLGALSARAGGAPVAKAVFRVTFWGAIAMAVTAGVGALFGVAAG